MLGNQEWNSEVESQMFEDVVPEQPEGGMESETGRRVMMIMTREESAFLVALLDFRWVLVIATHNKYTKNAKKCLTWP